MVAADGGWWSAELPDSSDAGADYDYGFRLDDDDVVLPDPRSRRQPAGVDGLEPDL